jgi:hypothetical protein
MVMVVKKLGRLNDQKDSDCGRDIRDLQVNFENFGICGCLESRAWNDEYL